MFKLVQVEFAFLELRARQRVKSLIEQRAANVLGRLEARVERACLLQFLEHRLGYGGVGFDVQKVLAHHARRAKPMLKQLGGQFDSVTKNIRARQALESRVRQCAVQSMPELRECK